MSSQNTAQFLEKKYLDFLKSQEVYSEPFHNKLGQLRNFYLPICEKIYLINDQTLDIKIVHRSYNIIKLNFFSTCPN